MFSSMKLLLVILLVAVFYLGLALATAVVARRKRRSFFGWLLLGLIFPIAILFAVIANPLPPGSARAEAKSERRRGRIPCPHCAEFVRAEASICPHCGRNTGPEGLREPVL